MDVRAERTPALCAQTCRRIYMTFECQEPTLPSDHAPVSLTVTVQNVDVYCLERQVSWLGNHAVLQQIMKQSKVGDEAS